MKKKDMILIAIIFAIALISLGTVTLIERLTSAEDGVAVVHYRGAEILRIDLRDGSYEIIDETYVHTDRSDFDNHLFVVQGTTADEAYDVTIQYKDHKVQVIDEKSPQNICQYQGATNSRLRPITCLPNHVVITIETGTFDPDDDDIIIE